MSEDLLNSTQIRAAFEEVRGSAMPQPMRADVSNVSSLGNARMNDASRGRGMEPPSASAEQQRRSALLGNQPRPANVQPLLDGPDGRNTDRNDALPAALAEDPHRTALTVEIVDVQPTGFADTDPRRVQQFQESAIPQADRVTVLQRIHELRCFFLTQHLRKTPHVLRRAQEQSRVR